MHLLVSTKLIARRSRAGFVFTRSPSIVEADDAAAAAILADDALEAREVPPDFDLSNIPTLAAAANAHELAARDDLVAGLEAEVSMLRARVLELESGKADSGRRRGRAAVDPE